MTHPVMLEMAESIILDVDMDRATRNEAPSTIRVNPINEQSRSQHCSYITAQSETMDLFIGN